MAILICKHLLCTFIVNFTSSIYSGHHSILIAPSEVETNPAVWLTAVSNNKGQFILPVQPLLSVYILATIPSWLLRLKSRRIRPCG